MVKYEKNKTTARNKHELRMIPTPYTLTRQNNEKHAQYAQEKINICTSSMILTKHLITSAWYLVRDRRYSAILHDELEDQRCQQLLALRRTDTELRIRRLDKISKKQIFVSNYSKIGNRHNCIANQIFGWERVGYPRKFARSCWKRVTQLRTL